MAQHDYSIANQGFPATRADINNVLSAIATNNSGTSAPSTQYAGQFWIDTTSSTWTLYIHDGADDIQFATIDTSANTVNFIDSALDVVTDTTPQLGGDLDLNSSDITGTGNINITGSLTASGNLTSLGIDDNATSTAITIDSSENVGIGTASPSRQFEIYDDGTNGQAVMAITAQNTQPSRIFFADPDDNNIGFLSYDHSDDSLRTVVNNAERMRIDSGGNLLVGKTSTSFSSTGVNITNAGLVNVTTSLQAPMQLNRINNEGNLINFYHDSTKEGDIDVFGSTVSYNGFTGTHWSRFTDNSTPTILRGTVLESLDEMCDWYNLEFDVTTTTQNEDGNDITNTVTKKIPHVLTDTQSVGDIITYNHEGTDYQATIVKEADIKHMKSKVSDTVDAKNVYGVFSAWDEDGEGYNDFIVASVGSFVVRIKANETIAKGDLLQSNGDGTAKVQTDDNVKSSSFAKVLSTTIIETYEDGSYLVPCSLMS